MASGTAPAVAYLLPALDRPNITLSANSHATRLLFDAAGKRCTGVEYVQDGQLKQAFAGKEVVVCLGALESPHLLLNSGIGSPEQLRQFDKPVVVDLPGVGENFHNHVLTGLIAETKDPVAPGHLNTSEAALFCKSDPGYTVPDLQFNFVHLPFDVIVGQSNPNSVSLIPGLQRPLSRGWVRLAQQRSAGPAAAQPELSGRGSRRAAHEADGEHRPRDLCDPGVLQGAHRP